MAKDPKKRLGHKSSKEITSHQWFSNINWNDIENKNVLDKNFNF